MGRWTIRRRRRASGVHRKASCCGNLNTGKKERTPPPAACRANALLSPSRVCSDRDHVRAQESAERQPASCGAHQPCVCTIDYTYAIKRQHEFSLGNARQSHVGSSHGGSSGIAGGTIEGLARLHQLLSRSDGRWGGTGPPCFRNRNPGLRWITTFNRGRPGAETGQAHRDRPLGTVSGGSGVTAFYCIRGGEKSAFGQALLRRGVCAGGGSPSALAADFLS